LVFGGSLLLAYGHELFSFYLTIDEDSMSTVEPVVRALGSVSEGRWGMAVLTLLVPNPVVPVVSTGLGVSLSALAWWILAHRIFELPRWAAALVCAAAGTIPVFAFILSFSAIAFGIGVGNLFVVAFAAGIVSRSWLHRAGAVLAATVAIAIYDSFLVAVAAVALGLAARRPQFSTLGLGISGAVLSILLSRGIGSAASLATGALPSGYIGAFFDLSGAIAQPFTRLKSALSDVWSVVSLSPDLFGLTSNWLAVLVTVVVIAAIGTSFSGTLGWLEQLIRLSATLGLLALPVLAEFVASTVVLRSMFYLPIVFIALASVAWHGVAGLRVTHMRITRIIVATLIALTVVGNATVTNRLYAVAETTYALDRSLAFTIGQEKDRLLGGDNLKEVPVLVSGLHSWPKGVFTDTRETLGLSAFELGSGRTAKFLNAHGVLVFEVSSPNEIESATEKLRDMPNYPERGWIALEDGVLILNFERDDL
jgi:hypothetical protein